MEDLKRVLEAKIPPSERILWARIYFLVGYKAFTGVHADVASIFDMNVWTFKSQLNALRARGAINMRSRKNRDREIKGLGSRFELVPPDRWLPQSPD